MSIELVKETDPPFRPEPQRIADLDLLGAENKGPPGRAIDALVQGGADAGISPPAFQLRRDNAGVVEHQTIASAQQPRQIAHMGMGKRRVPRDHQQPCRIARVNRAQGYALWRQVKIEQVNAHGSGAAGYPPAQSDLEWLS